MALTHVITEIRPYLTSYILRITITDTVTGKIYSREFNLDHSPDSTEQDALATLAKTRIQIELDFEANAMNLTSDEDRLLEYYRGIKRDIVLRIRAVPGATLAQAQTYIAGEYPDSMFVFAELYAIWRNMIGVTTWADFKTWVIDHKFRGID